MAVIGIPWPGELYIRRVGVTPEIPQVEHEADGGPDEVIGFGWSRWRLRTEVEPAAEDLGGTLVNSLSGVLGIVAVPLRRPTLPAGAVSDLVSYRLLEAATEVTVETAAAGSPRVGDYLAIGPQVGQPATAYQRTFQVVGLSVTQVGAPWVAQVVPRMVVPPTWTRVGPAETVDCRAAGGQVGIRNFDWYEGGALDWKELRDRG